MKKELSTPIAIIIFNRPDYVVRLIDILRSVKPKSLYVIADGPRDHVETDAQLCADSRLAIEQIDWPCEIHRRFLDKNLGCGHTPASGLDWVFSNEETCIVLEDDCLPHVSFFRFCEEMLELYRDNQRVMMISGNNHLLGKCDIAESYFFSINTQTNGWATWRRAWARYDFYMKDWPVLGSLNWLTSYLGDKQYAKSWLKTFDKAYLEANSRNLKCSYWDYQWTYCCWKNSALNVIPNINLVSNWGYGENATHVTPIDHLLARLPVFEMKFPLIHPIKLSQNEYADNILKETVYGHYSVPIRLLRKFKRVLSFKFINRWMGAFRKIN